MSRMLNYSSSCLPNSRTPCSLSRKLSLTSTTGMARGVISDKWSMRVLWLCAIGSGITLFMVAQERQLQNRQRMLAEGLKDAESGATTGEEV